MTDLVIGVATHHNGNWTISYTAVDGSLNAEIFLPLRRDAASVEAYTSYLDEQSATYVVINMGGGRRPILRDRYQIPPLRLRSLKRVKDQAYTSPKRSVFMR